MSAPERRAIGGELIIPALAVAFTVYYFVSIHEAPWTAKVSTYLIGGVLIALSLLFAALALRELLARRADLSARVLLEPAQLRGKRAGLLALTLAYIVVLEWSGFTITTFVFVLAGMLVLGGARAARIALVLAAVYALGGYVLFVALFDTRFPAGPFERLIAQLVG